MQFGLTELELLRYKIFSTLIDNTYPGSLSACLYGWSGKGSDKSMFHDLKLDAMKPIAINVINTRNYQS